MPHKYWDWDGWNLGHLYVVEYDQQECVLYTPYYGVVRDLKYDMTRHPFYDQISDGNGVPPYVWGEADLALGGVRVLDPSYAGELTVLPKASGVLLEVEE